MRKTKKTVLAALFSAFGVILLAVGSVLDVLDISTAVLASLIPLFFVAEFGKSYAAAVYAVISVLSLLLLPNRAPALLFAALFGYLPIVKYPLEHLGRVRGWILKILLYNAILIPVGLLFGELLGIELENRFGIPKTLMIALYLLLANALMLLCDRLYDRLLRLYLMRIRSKILKFLR